PTIPAQALIFADDSVTGNYESRVIAGARPSHSAHGFWFLNRGGNFLIGACLAEWYPPQLLPDLPLKGGGLDVERQIHIRRFSRNQFEHLIQPEVQCRTN